MQGRRKLKSWQVVLVYGKAKTTRAAIRRHYEKYRQERNIPRRCDNSDCCFHSNPLVWNGRELPLILDHKDGNTGDNRPEMLRYLCPNCDAQLPTRGGKNKGRIRGRSDNEFLVVERDGRKSYTCFGSAGAVVGGSADISTSPATANRSGDKST